jgi:hypothetical protein
MPYKRIGKCVYKANTGEKVGCSKTTAEAKKYLQVLNMREAGVPPLPKGKKSK